MQQSSQHEDKSAVAMASLMTAKIFRQRKCKVAGNAKGFEAFEF
jgi:hypothetical protein